MPTKVISIVYHSIFKVLWHYWYYYSATNFCLFQMNEQLDCALDLMRRLPPQQITKNLCDLVDLVLKYRTFYPHNAVLARVLDGISCCVCVCLLHAGIVSRWLLGLSWFFAQRFPSTHATLCCKEIRVSKNNGTAPWNFVRDTLLRKEALL